MRTTFPSAVVAGALLAVALSAGAQPPADAEPETCEGAGFVPMPDYQSVEVLGDGRVTFRICAPEATTVRLISSDAADVIPVGFGGETPGLAMSKDDDGLWTVTTPAPLEVDTFRFVFRVNGVDVADPEGSSVIGGYPGGVSSVVATGREAGAFQAYDKNVPHGAISRIEYFSSSLNVKTASRRLHATRLHDGRCGLSRPLSRPRRRRSGRRLDRDRAGALHPRQPDRGRQGRTDDHRHATRPHAADGPTRTCSRTRTSPTTC